jgi:hypothetical protein
MVGIEYFLIFASWVGCLVLIFLYSALLSRNLQPQGVTTMKNADVRVASELIRLAKQLAAQDGEDEEVAVEDEQFVAKLRDLRSALLKLGRRKNMRLQKFGIGMIRPNNKVSDLVDALLKISVAQ